MHHLAFCLVFVSACTSYFPRGFDSWPLGGGSPQLMFVDAEDCMEHRLVRLVWVDVLHHVVQHRRHGKGTVQGHVRARVSDVCRASQRVKSLLAKMRRGLIPKYT